jgi:hypothetical protein
MKRQSMRNRHYQNESALSRQQYNPASNLESNLNGYGGLNGGCSSSGGPAAVGAGLGMMGGMAMESAAQPKQSRTIVENVAPPSYAAPLQSAVRRGANADKRIGILLFERYLLQACVQRQPGRLCSVAGVSEER